MMKSLITKAFSILLMIAAPIISGMAFLEYFHIKMQHLKPSYPFGKWILETGLPYDKSMLYIGIAAFAFAVLAYISLLIKSFIRIVIILFIIAVVYFISKQF
ncbi:MAG: hypothetical protein K9G64_06805 [Bacteroidia bacterium]|nr:hypothetical protein [Bacteroidia bacterium]